MEDSEYEKLMLKFKEQLEKRRLKAKERYHADLDKSRASARLFAKDRYARIKANPIEYALYIEKQMVRNFAHNILKKKIFEKFDNKCSVCGTSERLELHHINYTLNPDDIVLVCHKCHINHFHK